MKLHPLLLPAAAIVISAVWLVMQRSDLSALEASNGTLTAAIARARSDAGGAGEESVASRRPAKPFHHAGKIDWRRIAEASRQPGNQTDMRLMVSLQKTLRGLSAEELLAGIGEIRQLDLPENVRGQVEFMLIGILAEKDPQLALEKFSAEVFASNNGGLQWQLSHAFQKWSLSDPATATAWMDARIADGSFDSRSLDGKNQNRLRFEAALIGSIIATDPSAAAARLADIPADQRADLFQHGAFHGNLPKLAKPLVELIRSQVPEDQRLPVLAGLTGPLVHLGGYDRVTRTLGEIDASPAERAAIVAGAVETLLVGSDTPGTFEETRAWIAAEAPADAERITGQALAHLAAKQGFAEASRLALEQQQRSGNDDALVAFLRNAPVESHTEILELAERITDPQARELVTNRFLNNPTRLIAPQPTPEP